MNTKKQNTKQGNQTQLSANAHIIGSNITNIGVQYDVPSPYGVNLLCDENVEDAKKWVDENHK